MPSLCIFVLIEAPTRLRFSDFFLNFYSRLLMSSGKMGQIDQNWGAEYGHFYFGWLKNHKITHLPPHYTMCTSIIGYKSRFINFLKLLCLIQPLTLSVSQIYAMKLRFPLRQTWVDSDFIQNIWAIIWQVGALLLPLNQVWNIFRLSLSMSPTYLQQYNQVLPLDV